MISSLKKRLVSFLSILLPILVFAGCRGDESTLTRQKNVINQETVLGDDLAIYFRREMIRHAGNSIADYENLGLGESADAFTLMKVYPGLNLYDFENVKAEGGTYTIKKQRLYFTGNTASDSPAITAEGFGILLRQCCNRRRLNLKQRSDIDLLLKQLLKAA